jgi:hypothetical protein
LWPSSTSLFFRTRWFSMMPLCTTPTQQPVKWGPKPATSCILKEVCPCDPFFAACLARWLRGGSCQFTLRIVRVCGPEFRHGADGPNATVHFHRHRFQQYCCDLVGQRRHDLFDWPLHGSQHDWHIHRDGYQCGRQHQVRLCDRFRFHHPYQRFLAQSSRALVWTDYRTHDPPRYFSQRQGVGARRL